MPALITPADRIFVAGHRGMAGSAICRALHRAGYLQLLTATRQELDLRDGPAVERWFADHQHLHAGGCLLVGDCSDGHLCRAACGDALK